MDINGRILLFVLTILGYGNVPAQQHWSVELSGGPSISYTQNEVHPYSRHFSELNTLGFSSGITGLYSLSSQWDLGGEIGLASRTIGIKLIDIPLQNGYISKYVKYADVKSPLFSLGARWTYRKSSWGLYVYPSLGVIYNSDNLSFGQLNIDVNQQVEQNELFYRHKNNLGYFTKLDLGVRFFTKQNNYFLIGLRHVHGFNELENYYSDNFSLLGDQYSFRAINKGSFSALVLGYGIDLSSFSLKGKSSAKPENSGKMLIREMALSGGEYVAFSSGIRIKSNRQKNAENVYSNVNGLVSLVYGYRFDHLSAEMGIAGFFDNNYIQIDHSDKEALIFLSNPYSVWTIPVTLKYDLNLDPQGAFRIGGLFSTNFIVRSTSDRQWAEEFEGRFSTNSVEVNYQGVLTANEIRLSKRFFFKGGVFMEALIGRSNFLSLQLSRNFGSPVLSSYRIEYSIDDDAPVSKTVESSVSGVVLELGLRKPISIFKIKKRLL